MNRDSFVKGCLVMLGAAVAASPSTAGADGTIRIATFNLRYGSADDGANAWSRRKEILFACLDGMRPQILCTQEGLPFQLDEIKERLPFMDRFGLGRFDGVRTDRSHELYSGEHCAVFYDMEMFLLEATGTFWLSDTPEAAGSRSWGNNLPRIATWGVLRRRADGRRFTLCNTHYDNGTNQAFRTGATRLLQARIADISRGMPVLLTGDFNLGPESDAHKTLTADLADAWTALKMPEDGAGSSHGFTGVPEKRIDWILFSPAFEALSIEKVTYNASGRYPSDHFPVLAELRMK